MNIYCHMSGVKKRIPAFSTAGEPCSDGSIKQIMLFPHDLVSFVGDLALKTRVCVKWPKNHPDRYRMAPPCESSGGSSVAVTVQLLLVNKACHNRAMALCPGSRETVPQRRTPSAGLKKSELVMQK